MQKVIIVNDLPQLSPPLPRRGGETEEKQAAGGGGINYLACPPRCWRGLSCRAVMEMTKVNRGENRFRGEGGLHVG